MKLAFNQARKILGNTSDNPAVGCVVVKNNVVLSLTHTNIKGRPHAERIALSNNKINFTNSSIYSTLEPCSHLGKTSPCIDIIMKKKIKSVYFSKYDPDLRSYKKAKNKLYKKKILTYEKLCFKKGDNFYRDFYLQKKTDRIFITSKLATSKDYFISNRHKKLITNIYSRGRVHLLRSTHDAILTTSNTILQDNSILNCRINGLEKYSPKRFILDKDLTISTDKKIIKTASKIKTYIFYNFSDSKKLKKFKKLKVKTIKVDLKDNHLDFDKIIFILRKMKIKRVLVEAGIKFNKFLLENNYINDFYHFYSNKYFKNNGFHNTKFFFNKMNKLKKNKKKVIAYLYQDKLVKYLIN